MKRKVDKKTPLVSVIIPTYNRGKPLCTTLKSLFLQNYPNFEIIVVDQSTKKFPVKDKFIASNKKKIRYFISPTIGASRARNVGLENAFGDIVVFLDDDVYCFPSLISSHIKNYKDESVGAVAGWVVNQGQISEPKRKNVGRITWLGRFTDGFSSSSRQEVMTAITCNASFRKKVIDEVGKFDENFTGPIREDSDLSLRVKKKGYKIVFDPKAKIIHLRAKSGGFRKSEGRMKWYYGFFKSETYFFLKYWPKVLVPLIILTRFEWIMRCMFGFGREVSWRSIKTPWQGIYDGFKTYKRGKNENRS